MDPERCNALVDFNIPGYPKPPPVPVRITATVWIQSLQLPTGTIKKYVIEWTDLSGKITSPSVPMNTWVQDNATFTPRSCIEGAPIVFKDMRDGDSKKVALSDNHLFITPVGSDDRLSTSLL